MTRLMYDDPVRLLVLSVALCAIGWVFGFGAALFLRSARGETLGPQRRARFLGVLLALAIGAACLFSYTLVLAEVGVFYDPCAPGRLGSQLC